MQFRERPWLIALALALPRWLSPVSVWIIEHETKRAENYVCAAIRSIGAFARECMRPPVPYGGYRMVPGAYHVLDGPLSVAMSLMGTTAGMIAEKKAAQSRLRAKAYQRNEMQKQMWDDAMKWTSRQP
jgi:hypothetical protein